MRTSMPLRCRTTTAPATAAASLLLLCAVLMHLVPAAAQQPLDGMVLYKIFSSYSCAACTQAQQDGPSGVATLARASGGTVGAGSESLIVCDSGAAGATVRIVNRSGLFTVAGNRAERGWRDGAANTALFNNPSSVVLIDGTMYVADTDNNRIRNISASGMVGTFLGETQLSKPTYIMPYRRPSGTYDLFVSDTNNSRIVFTPLTDVPPVTVFMTNLQPGEMQISESRQIMYVIREESQIVAIDVSSAGTASPRSWNVGNIGCTGYKSGLMLTANEEELYYYGNKAGQYVIMSLSAVADAVDAPQLCPNVVMNWSDSRSVSLVSAGMRGFYVVNASDVFLVRDSTFTQTLTIDEYRTPTPTASVTPTGQMLETPTPTATPSASKTLTEGRPHAVAAFPTASLPVSFVRFIHEMYAWMMRDVRIAFGTDDFFAAFEPLGYNDVPGSANVSTWNNLTAQLSYDGSILITHYYGPFGMMEDEAQASLFDSLWKWAREFHESLRKRDPPIALDDFCIINCTSECRELSYEESMCIGYKKPPLCNDVCIGAIVSSVVLGATGIALIALMIGSPANVKTAFLRVPAF
ncbi:flagellum-adhesion glycoprotein [Trypanosoma grayi]|uniref:flagellum-adhesion glycoprotein n=1 Tax=Trypanosoma grayi TaxID=71804 RepID=UPI0004F4248F|nr:flagellum-adhesion glycoprotein [Trypanosoma grayi]KEG10309.1 flagellum-adhesion glycoprotein [Trypanosoma grayi]